MERGLAWISIVLVAASVLMAAVIRIYDCRHGTSVIRRRHGSRNPLSMSFSGMAIMGLLYAAIAFSQNLALEWLAAIALFCFFAASAVDRVGTARLAMLRSEISDEAVPPREEHEDKTPDSEPIPIVATEILDIICDVVSWVAAIDLVVLFFLALVESVAPYYLGLVVS